MSSVPQQQQEKLRQAFVGAVEQGVAELIQAGYNRQTATYSVFQLLMTTTGETKNSKHTMYPTEAQLADFLTLYSMGREQAIMAWSISHALQQQRATLETFIQCLHQHAATTIPICTTLFGNHTPSSTTVMTTTANHPPPPLHTFSSASLPTPVSVPHCTRPLLSTTLTKPQDTTTVAATTKRKRQQPSKESNATKKVRGWSPRKV